MVELLSVCGKKSIEEGFEHGFRGFIIRFGNGLGTGTKWVLERRIYATSGSHTHTDREVYPRCEVISQWGIVE